MKRSTIVIIVIAILVVVGGGIWLLTRRNADNSSQVAASPTPVATVQYRGEDNRTVLDLLKVNAVIELSTASTPVVISVNGVANTTTYYWTFYVNGKRQAVERANVYLTRPNDQVEWRYISTAEEK